MASARGSILGVSLREELVRHQVISVVVDRECGAIDVAKAQGIPCLQIDDRDNERFSDALLAHCADVGADHIALFFSRLLVGEVLSRYDRRIVNIHPAALPAFPGLQAFERAWRSDARFLGTTVHFIDEHVDQGHVILQSMLPIDRRRDPAELRHRQFEQMCKGFVQTCYWLEEGRIGFVDGRVEVAGAHFEQTDFSPGLDAPAALHLSVPYRPGNA